MTGLASRLPTRLRRFVGSRRRLIAAVLAAAAVASGVGALRPAPQPRVSVLAAASDLPGGTRLVSKTLATVALPPQAVPSGALRSRSNAVGRVLAGPVRAGEPLTDARLVGEPMVAQEGMVATPVRIADTGVARLLRPGDRVDVLAATARGDSLGEAAQVVAPGVRVVTVPGRGGGDDPARAEPGIAQGALVVLATTAEEAAQLAAAAVTSRLSVVLRDG